MAASSSHPKEKKSEEVKPLNSMYALAQGINPEAFNNIVIDEESRRLWDLGDIDQRYAVVGWVMKDKVELRFQPGFSSDTKPEELKTAKEKFGENVIVVSEPGRPGIVHAKTIDQITSKKHSLDPPKAMVGFSVHKKANHVCEWLNRSSQNVPTFPRDPLAIACNTFPDSYQRGYNLEYQLNRSIPEAFFIPMVEHATRILNKGKIPEEKDTQQYCKCGDCHFKYPRAWDEIREMKDLEMRDDAIKKALMNNIYIASGTLSNPEKSVQTHTIIKRAFRLAEKYKLTLDLEYVPRALNATHSALMRAAILLEDAERSTNPKVLDWANEVVELLIANGADTKTYFLFKQLKAAGLLSEEAEEISKTLLNRPRDTDTFINAFLKLKEIALHFNLDFWIYGRIRNKMLVSPLHAHHVIDAALKCCNHGLETDNDIIRKIITDPNETENIIVAISKLKKANLYTLADARIQVINHPEKTDAIIDKYLGMSDLLTKHPGIQQRLLHYPFDTDTSNIHTIMRSFEDMDKLKLKSSDDKAIRDAIAKNSISYAKRIAPLLIKLKKLNLPIEVDNLTDFYFMFLVLDRIKKLEEMKFVDEYTNECAKEKKEVLSPANFAARTGNFDALKELTELEIDLDQRDLRGNKPVHYAVAGNHADMLKYLHSHIPDLNLDEENANGLTCLQQATKNGSLEMVQQLIELKADVNKETKNGLPPACIAISQDRVDILRELVRQGAKLISTEQANSSPLHSALLNSKVESSKYLIQECKMDPSQGAPGLFSVLHIAARYGFTDAIQLMKKCKPDLDLNRPSHTNHDTAAHVAIYFNNESVVYLLAQYKADFNQKNSSHFTPLSMAIKRNNWTMIAAMLASMRKEDYAKLTPEDQKILKKNRKNLATAFIQYANNSAVQDDVYKRQTIKDILNNTSLLGLVLQKQPKIKSGIFRQGTSKKIKMIEDAFKTYLTSEEKIIPPITEHKSSP